MLAGGRMLAVLAAWLTAGLSSLQLPRIIQGGMGARVSSWKLARAVALEGQLGLTSGVAMDAVFVRSLQDGDPEGIIRRSLAAFPDQDMANRFIDKYYVEGGKDPARPYKPLPMWTLNPPQMLVEATVLANFCEATPLPPSHSARRRLRAARTHAHRRPAPQVWLAKHDDDGNPIECGNVGINLLTKIQLPNVPSLFGAMLAGADYVVMGAGIPMEIPGILDDLSEGKPCKLVIDTEGATAEQQQESAAVLLCRH